MAQAQITYESLESIVKWIRTLEMPYWDLFQIGEGNEYKILQGKDSDLDKSLDSLQAVVKSTSTFNENTKYRIVVKSSNNSNATSYTKYFTLNGILAAQLQEKKETQPQQMGGLNGDVLMFYKELFTNQGATEAKLALVVYREQELIRKETELNEKVKAEWEKFRKETEKEREKYQDSMYAFKEGIGNAFVQGAKLITGMDFIEPQKGIAGVESTLSKTQLAVIETAKAANFTDNEWLNIGKLIKSTGEPAVFTQYFDVCLAVWTKCQKDNGKIYKAVQLIMNFNYE